MTCYQILIADQLLDPELGMQWPEGVKLASQLDAGPAGTHWYLLDDPAAPGELDGKQCEIKVRRVGGKPEITSRRVILTHQCPDGDEAFTPCCGQEPFSLSHMDRITSDPEQVTCEGPFVPRPGCTCGTTAVCPLHSSMTITSRIICGSLL